VSRTRLLSWNEDRATPEFLVRGATIGAAPPLGYGVGIECLGEAVDVFPRVSLGHRD
jgi:hypothetical protein